MHDTAFHIGSLAMNIYADLSTASVLEIGSRSVNGSLRTSALAATKYVGIDIEEGEGVDVVVEPGSSFPVENDAFDLVIASSVFEHDPAFWMTFLEMCRKTKIGGYVYINAPSNGIVHRYPQDNWRFYPDAGAALTAWAVSQGQHVTLVESFIADRQDDIWNDFVAVFRKGRITKGLPRIFLHENIPCSNVMTWKSREIINPRDLPEDVILLQQAHERERSIEQSLSQAISSRDEATREAGMLRSHIAERESEARQRESEARQLEAQIQQKLADEADRRRHAEASANQWKDLYDRQLAFLADTRNEFELAGKEQERRHADQLTKAEAAMREQVQEANAKIAAAESARQKAQSSTMAIEAKLGARFQEIATLTSLLRQEEQSSIDTRAKFEWLRAANETLLSQPKWWVMMPREWRRRRERARLQRRGLFDGDEYLARYPDVAVAGFDPLDHYMLHGIDEGRLR